MTLEMTDEECDKLCRFICCGEKCEQRRPVEVSTDRATKVGYWDYPCKSDRARREAEEIFKALKA